MCVRIEEGILTLGMEHYKKSQKLVIDDSWYNNEYNLVEKLPACAPFPCGPLCIGSSYGQQSTQYLPHSSA